MKAIRYIRSVPRWLLVRTLGPHMKGLATGGLSCIQLAEVEAPPLPKADWVRIRPKLSGICGSDLSTIACKGSPYFAPFVSTPFVLGHELVGAIEETGPETPAEWKVGTRVVLEPALGCAVRGIDPPCEPCARGAYVHCTNILKGNISGGIQTGYCRSTGGGWSSSLVAHPSQLHAVPDGISDEQAVLIEPFACALHGALFALRGNHKKLLVIGCGSIGLMTIAAYRALGGSATLYASARYPHQAEMAKTFGADEICTERSTNGFYKWVLERSGRESSDPGTLHQPEIGKPVPLGGLSCVLDCVGSATSIDDSLRLTAPGGSVVLVGMPGIPKGVDWTALWYKELNVQGAYAYGWEKTDDLSDELKVESDNGKVKTMDLAIRMVAQGKLDTLKELVRHTFPLSEYRTALDLAFNAGRKGAYKVVFRNSEGA